MMLEEEKGENEEMDGRQSSKSCSFSSIPIVDKHLFMISQCSRKWTGLADSIGWTRNQSVVWFGQPSDTGLV